VYGCALIERQITRICSTLDELFVRLGPVLRKVEKENDAAPPTAEDKVISGTSPVVDTLNAQSRTLWVIQRRLDVLLDELEV
jgi:hypothetical protein